MKTILELLTEALQHSGYKLFHLEREQHAEPNHRDGLLCLRVEETLDDGAGRPRFAAVAERLGLAEAGAEGGPRWITLKAVPALKTGTYRLDGSRSPIRRPRAVIVLQALLAGVPVRLGRHNFVLQRGDDFAQLMASCTRVSFGAAGKEEEVLVGTNLEVGDFVTLCERLTEDEVFWIGANCALTEMAQLRAAVAGR